MNIGLIIYGIGQLLFYIGMLIYWISYYRDCKRRQEYWESLESRYAELNELICKSNEDFNKAIKKLDKISQECTFCPEINEVPKYLYEAKKGENNLTDINFPNLTINDFYKSRNEIVQHHPFCKDCVNESINIENLDTLLDVLKILDTPFILDVWNEALKNTSGNCLGEYLRLINFTYKIKYSGSRFKDSIYESLNNEDIEIITNILNRGNQCEIKKERENVVIVEIKRSALIKKPIIQ